MKRFLAYSISMVLFSASSMVAAADLQLSDQQPKRKVLWPVHPLERPRDVGWAAGNIGSDVVQNSMQPHRDLDGTGTLSQRRTRQVAVGLRESRLDPDGRLQQSGLPMTRI
jgi:hypothetical protein